MLRASKLLITGHWFYMVSKNISLFFWAGITMTFCDTNNLFGWKNFNVKKLSFFKVPPPPNARGLNLTRLDFLCW